MWGLNLGKDYCWNWILLISAVGLLSVLSHTKKIKGSGPWWIIEALNYNCMIDLRLPTM
jgi:hypothetical protein